MKLKLYVDSASSTRTLLRLGLIGSWTHGKPADTVVAARDGFVAPNNDTPAETKEDATKLRLLLPVVEDVESCSGSLDEKMYVWILLRFRRAEDGIG